LGVVGEKKKSHQMGGGEPQPGGKTEKMVTKTHKNHLWWVPKEGGGFGKATTAINPPNKGVGKACQKPRQFPKIKLPTRAGPPGGGKKQTVHPNRGFETKQEKKTRNELPKKGVFCCSAHEKPPGGGGGGSREQEEKKKHPWGGG